MRCEPKSRAKNRDEEDHADPGCFGAGREVATQDAHQCAHS